MVVYEAKISEINAAVDIMKKLKRYKLLAEVNTCKIYRENSVVIDVNLDELILISPSEDSIIKTLEDLGIKNYKKLM
ncbi:MAG: hypothetical protein QMD14_00820 [Candidatus Aenigmarchaeota archaeon]|nr:hypothetical protein [Candidatus Aenigmarchaeota archaeon]